MTPVGSDIKEGDVVLYHGREYRVTKTHVTCPCAFGNYQHHPADDVVAVTLEDGRTVPGYMVNKKE